MRVTTNQALIRRRVRLSVLLFFLSTGLMGGGFILTLDQGDDPGRYAVATTALLVGLGIWAVNQGYLTRYSPRNRQDGALHQALRGLDDRYHLFAFPGGNLPDYLLVGPMGVVILIARATSGTIICEGERWRRVERAPLPLRVLLWFSRTAPLGNPNGEALQGHQNVARYLAERLPPEEVDATPIHTIAVFSHPAVELTTQSCAIPAVRLRGLRSHLRTLPRTLRPDEARKLAAAFGAGDARPRAHRR